MGDSSLPKLTCGRLATTALPGGGSFAFASAAGMQPQDKLDSQVCTFLLMLLLCHSSCCVTASSILCQCATNLWIVNDCGAKC